MIAWRGRRGTVLLGPTEDRVARYLDAATADGWIRVRTPELASRLGLERSEAYRITARLRVLGLFGVANDHSGARGGRRYWRTAIRHDGPTGLDPLRHAIACARLAGWSRARGTAVRRALDHIRAARARPSGVRVTARAGGSHAHRPGPNLDFDALMRRYGAASLLDSWGARHA